MTDRIDRVIITGAGSGIGLDMARAFLARGSRLVVNGRDADKLERARRSLGDPARIFAVPGHVADPATARALAAAAHERLGGVDVLVNNAGIFAPKPFLESTAADLERFFETNVKGTYLVTQAIVPLMIEGGGGSIINVGAALVENPDALAAIHPLGRIGEVRDTSDAALYLATAGFVTGQTLAVDGGYSHGR